MWRPETGVDWRAGAACRQGDSEPDLWFPDGTTGIYLLQIEEAKAVCRRCPVMEACGDWALTTRQHHGVWGGLDERDRARLLRKKPLRQVVS